jgi:hypothetical protein
MLFVDVGFDKLQPNCALIVYKNTRNFPLISKIQVMKAFQGA